MRNWDNVKVKEEEEREESWESDRRSRYYFPGRELKNHLSLPRVTRLISASVFFTRLPRGSHGKKKKEGHFSSRLAIFPVRVRSYILKQQTDAKRAVTRPPPSPSERVYTRANYVFRLRVFVS